MNRRDFFRKAVYLFMGLVLFAGCAQKSDAARPSGDTVDFTFQSIDGKTYKLSDFRGKIVVVNFWATWCPPCRKEMPYFVKLQDEYKDDVQFIGLDVNETADKVKAFIQALGVNYIIGFSTPQIESIFGGVTGLPTTFIIDRQGHVVERIIGSRPETWFRRRLKALVNH